MSEIAYDTQELATPNGRPLSVLCRRDTNDWNTAYSIAMADEYALRGLALEGWALDLGGYTGVVSVCLALDNPGLEVWTVEPVPQNVEMIERNAERNGVADRVHVLEAALGEPGGSTQIRFGFRNPGGGYDHHAWVGNSSLVYADPPVEAHDELDVACVDLGQLARQIGDSGGIGPVPSFVKLDAEGGEWAALASVVALGSPRVIGEWHPVCGRTSVDELAEAFRAGGYAVDTSGPEGGPGHFLATR